MGVKEEAERAKKARDADQLRTLFQQIDLDGNGVLNFVEFQRAFQAAGGLGDISTAKEVLETAKAKKQARKEKEVKEAAEKAKKEKEAKEAADKAKKEQEAKEAAAKAKKEKEAKEKAKKEQEAKEAAAKV